MSRNIRTLFNIMTAATDAELLDAPKHFGEQ
jgi:hypothetical protein